MGLGGSVRTGRRFRDAWGVGWGDFASLVRLPGAVVAGIDVHCAAVGVDGGGGVLHLHVLVPHERPRRQVVAVQLQRAREVKHRLLVLALQREVVS
eukprot:1190241-Prorocentrum_minimum.AAC.1